MICLLTIKCSTHGRRVEMVAYIIVVTLLRQFKERGIPTANTRDTRDRMIVNDTNTWLIPEDI